MRKHKHALDALNNQRRIFLAEVDRCENDAARFDNMAMSDAINKAMYASRVRVSLNAAERYREHAEQIARSITVLEADTTLSAEVRTELLKEGSRAKRQLSAVRQLAERWRYKGEYGNGAWQEGHGPDIEGQVLDSAASELLSVIEEEK